MFGLFTSNLNLTRLMMVGIGLLSFIGQICLTISLQLEEAGKVVIVSLLCQFK